MKYEVIKRFKCKETGKSYRPQDAYETSKERGEYLQAAGFLGDKILEPKAKEEKAEEVEETERAPEIESLSYKELQELAKDAGIKATGVKRADLIEALKGK